MTRNYTPRRCGKKWLDGDCPAGVLAIIDDPKYPIDRYTVIYAEVQQDGRDNWLTFIACDEHGAAYHGEMKAHEIAEYRYRNKHRYAAWSSLPDAVKNAVRRDLARCTGCGNDGPFSHESNVCDACVRESTGVNP